jgi:adenine-specific DNA methylase
MMKMQTELFDLQNESAFPPRQPSCDSEARAIEDARFPFEEISKIAQQESWRKEINRPIYHIHKWWAQRLGSVFRALALGAFNSADADIIDLFYKPSRINGVVLDPFMGSGTTLGEVLKLGGRAIGQDINPTAHFLVKNALNLPHRDAVVKIYREIKADTAPKLLEYYSTRLPDGREAQVLYFFWVKVVDCLSCERPVDLFPSYVFAQNAYPNRKPEVRIVCPRCGGIHSGRHGADGTRCPECQLQFNPLLGPAGRAKATCTNCKESFSIVDAVQKGVRPPRHRLYAKLVVDGKGDKTYLAIGEHDRAAYERAEYELSTRANAYPSVTIEPGHNTNQAINYRYQFWHEMFNARQLLCLSILSERIRAIPNEQMRELFCCLFSGVLEFNNMFASYKGEGTGAVRHMFAHHVLKPERTPIEANIWGTSKSSGAFSTMFKSRVLRAIEYAENPFELRLDHETGKTEKVFGLSEVLTVPKAPETLMLRCGDSSDSGLAEGSVDAVITDPPFFDNVHYSELADFFHVWQRHVLGENGFHANGSTRTLGEVQHSDAEVFETRLANVWRECKRVLKADGLLIFTFHHSRPEGWRSLLGSLGGAGFYVVRVHPVRSEMSVAMPKHQAKEPIAFDIVFVCRKHSREAPVHIDSVVRRAKDAAELQMKRLVSTGFDLSKNDVRLLVTSNAVQLLSVLQPENSRAELQRLESDLESASRQLIMLARQ